MLSKLKKFFVQNSYDPTYINPHGLPSAWNFGSEAKDLTEKRQRMRQWMREKGIERPEVQRKEQTDE